MTENQPEAPTNDVQDPAEPYEVEKGVETGEQAEPSDVEGSEREVRNAVAPGSIGVNAGTGQPPTARERLEAEESADQESDDN